MKINHIREFLLLVSNRNFSKTAEQLYMAQSALSRHISPIKKDAEDTFRTTAGCSVPYIGALQSGQYQCEYTVKPIFIFQFSGSLSLTILEKATKTDLHDPSGPDSGDKYRTRDLPHWHERYTGL